MSDSEAISKQEQTAALKTELLMLPNSVQEKNEWLVYTISNCPFCEKIKSLMEEEKIEVTQINCDIIGKKEAADLLAPFTENYRKYPMIFRDRGSIFVGGFDKTKTFLHEKKLPVLVTDADF